MNIYCPPGNGLLFPFDDTVLDGVVLARDVKDDVDVEQILRDNAKKRS